MSVYYSDDAVTVHAGDCVEVMRTLPGASVDAVVTDPPYGLEFMGKEWDKFATGRAAKYARGGSLDPANIAAQSGKGGAGPSYVNRPAKRCALCGKQAWSGSPCRCAEPEWVMDNSPLLAFQAWCETWAAECLRVLKPGGHLLAFGGTRTYHRLACAIEDAGFEIRDSITWLYASGFPKSLRVNSDPRFCQCGGGTAATARSAVGIVPSPDAADRTSTEDLSALWTEGAPAPSAPHVSGSPQDSPAGYRPAGGSDGEPPQRLAAGDPSTSLLRPDVLARTHSTGLDDVPAAPGPSRSPQSSRTVHLATQGSPAQSASVGKHPDSPTSRTLALPGTSTASASRDFRSESKGEFRASAFPQCNRCGKPNADGLGTALKPASEPIVVARRPLSGTVAATVLAHGTGALNIDACRVDGVPRTTHADGNRRTATGGPTMREGLGLHDDPWPAPSGRWPSNVVLSHAEGCEQTGTRRVKGASNPDRFKGRPRFTGDAYAGDDYSLAMERGSAATYADADGLETVPTYTCQEGCPVAELDRQSGSSTSPSSPVRQGGTVCYDVGSGGAARNGEGVGYGDQGGSSRFFPTFRYQAKAGSAERPTVNGEAHSTVKPLALMRWLVKLVTPPGGLVLDPFAGSGTTAEACVLEHFRCLTIERDESYLPLIRARLTKPLQVGFNFEDGAA